MNCFLGFLLPCALCNFRLVYFLLCVIFTLCYFYPLLFLPKLFLPCLFLPSVIFALCYFCSLLFFTCVIFALVLLSCVIFLLCVIFALCYFCLVLFVPCDIFDSCNFCPVFFCFLLIKLNSIDYQVLHFFVQSIAENDGVRFFTINCDHEPYLKNLHSKVTILSLSLSLSLSLISSISIMFFFSECVLCSEGLHEYITQYITDHGHPSSLQGQRNHRGQFQCH